MLKGEISLTIPRTGNVSCVISFHESLLRSSEKVLAFVGACLYITHTMSLLVMVFQNIFQTSLSFVTSLNSMREPE